VGEREGSIHLSWSPGGVKDQTLSAIGGLFPGEAVVFPVGGLRTRRGNRSRRALLRQ
jgi:hypothetical protein